jgi:hypothetical protein
MAEARAPNPLVEQFKKGGVPKDVRLVAAQGTLPLGPLDLLELLVLLTADRDKEIQDAAHGTLKGQPADMLLPLFKDRGTPAAILAWGVKYRSERQLREAALQNTTLEDAAIEDLAPALPRELAELVVINQVRLLRRTSLLVAIEANPNLDNDQKRRLRELREEFIDERPERAPTPPPPPPPPPESEPEPIEEPEPITDEAEAMEHYLTTDERGEPAKLSAVQKIVKMNTAEKMVTALKGTREERTILIRDRNRLVSTSVLGSPKLTESEVEAFASMKNISDQVLREIGSNREWTRNYNVVAALVRNPRTPLATSIGMVSRLNPRDIKGLAMDRNVSEALRKQAQRFIRSQQERKN